MDIRTTSLRTATRSLLFLALALLAGAGCGDDKDDGGGNPLEPPTGGGGSFQFTIDPATVTVQHGASATATITLVRVSFDKPVQLSAEGLPAGVTASFSPATVPGNVTTSTLTLAAAPTAEVGLHEFTVRAKADGMAAMVNDQQLLLFLGRYVHVGDHTITIRGDAGDLTRTAELTVRVFQSRPVAAAWSHSLAIAEDGSLWTWGRNHHGQLGHGDATDRNAPARVGADKDWIAVAGGNSHSVALNSDGTLWVAGDNGYGQLGVAGAEHATFQQVGTDSDWVAIAAGDDFTLAIKADRTLWAWGRNISGELGLGEAVEATSPQQVGSAMDWVSVSTGGGFTLALDADGFLWSTGANSRGRLGIAEPGEHNRYELVQALGSAWEFVSAGEGHTLAIGPDGLLYAWGSNDFGQLGLGTDAVQGNGPIQSIRARWP